MGIANPFLGRFVRHAMRILSIKASCRSALLLRSGALNVNFGKISVQKTT